MFRSATAGSTEGRAAVTVLRRAILAVAIGTSGCVGIPEGRYVLQDVKVTGNEELADDEIEEKLASRESPRFLGLVPGFIYDYEIFDRYVLERDLQRVERYYRARGFYSAKARAARVFYDGRNVRVHIVVEEGEPVLLRRVDVHGLDGLPERVAREARRRVLAQLEIGEPFEEEAFENAQRELVAALGEFGYARATSRKNANVDIARGGASVGFWVEPGTPARFGEVRIEGLGPLPAEPVSRALAIRAGDPYDRSELDEAERAVLNLGVFSAVEISPDLGEPTRSDRVPLLVRLEPSRLRSIHLGGGIQADALRTDFHLTAGWEDRNFLGGMRRFQIEAQPGIVLYPTRVPGFQVPERLLPMARLRVDFREPGFIESRTNAIVRTEGNMYPVLVTSEHEEGTPVLGVRDARASIGLERSYWKAYSELTQNFQLNSPFSYVGPLDPDLGTVFVSYPELFASLDLRDDALTPHSGLYVSNELQVAGLGGDARDIKIRPEVRAYVRVARRVTIAARSTVGLLFADNYGDTVETNALTGQPGEGVSRAAWVRDIQLMFLRGFFSGGPGSNRGYAWREVGPHGVVPFFNPGQSSETLFESCDPSSPDYLASVCDLPLGGFTLWELSLELRYPTTKELYGVVFADTSDVAPKVLQFRFDRPHLSVGVGLRYDTPVGPIRVDVGYRVPGAQAPDSADERVPNDVFGLPLALSFGIGEAF